MKLVRPWFGLMLSLSLAMPACMEWRSDSEICASRGGSWVSNNDWGTAADCVFPDSGAPSYGPDDPAPSATTDAAVPACWSDDGCGSRGRCIDGACSNEHPRCMHDDECGPGSRCAGGDCVCANDDACPTGMRCRLKNDAETACVACNDGQCASLQCEADQDCQAPLVCDADFGTCISKPDARYCAPPEFPCPERMDCGVDGICHYAPYRDKDSGGDEPYRDNDAGDGGAVDGADAHGDGEAHAVFAAPNAGESLSTRRA